MKFLLDTCVLSELTKPRPHERVVAWLGEREDAELGVSVLTLGELERGVQRLPSGTRKRAFDEWLRDLTATYEERLIDVDSRVALEWGRLAARSEARGRSLPVIDALLGATALVHGLTVVTRNTSDISRSGAKVLDPWKA